MKIKYIENCFSSLYLKIEKAVCICILFIVGEVEIGVKNCFPAGVQREYECCEDVMHRFFSLHRSNCGRIENSEL